MEPAIRGLVLDSTVLVAAERAKLTTPQVLRNIRDSLNAGDLDVVISAMTVAELAHGIYRVDSPEHRSRHRRVRPRARVCDWNRQHARLHPYPGFESRLPLIGRFEIPTPVTTAFSTRASVPDVR